MYKHIFASVFKCVCVLVQMRVNHLICTVFVFFCCNYFKNRTINI